MKQFYKTYKDDQFVTTLLTQISWSNHMLIISKAKTMEDNVPIFVEDKKREIKTKTDRYNATR